MELEELVQLEELAELVALAELDSSFYSSMDEVLVILKDPGIIEAFEDPCLKK